MQKPLNASTRVTRTAMMEDDPVVTASDTWQSIYVAIVLTTLQVTSLLLAFEIARRNPKFVSVYDRRRLRYPRRTPPPLRRRWYPTWWTIKLADDEYNSISRKEALEREEKEREARNQGEKNDHDKEILQQAEEYCRISVPYFRDLSNDDDEEMENAGGTVAATPSTSQGTNVMKASETSVEVSQRFSVWDTGGAGDAMSEDDDDDREVWDAASEELATTNGASLWPTSTSARKSTTNQGVSNSNETLEQVDKMEKEAISNESTTNQGVSSDSNETVELVDETEKETISNDPKAILGAQSKPLSLAKRPRSQSLPDTLSTFPTYLEQGSSSDRNLGNIKSLSEHSDVVGSVPFLVGGSSSAAQGNRRVRFDDVWAREDTTPSRAVVRADSNVTLGSRESQRLAKLRFEEDAVQSNWDREFARNTARFIKNRILMMRDSEEEEPPAQASVVEQQKRFISRQIMRRPLMAEDQELLRMLGLDAFMILRFLRLSTDVFFWPLLLAAVTLLPLYLTSGNGASGYFETTIIALIGTTGKYWLMVAFEYIHFCYILRRLWIEWELFMPLRYDFLEHGDFEKEKYKEQYRLTCLVEFVPAMHKNDQNLFHFFDTLFPGQVKRAEVLLNTEHLRKLIRERLGHIVAYENVFAKMVHERATYLRGIESYENHGATRRCCRSVMPKPREPSEPRKIVIHSVDRMDMHNAFVNPQTRKVKDPRTWYAREWHHRNIQRLNKEIDDEYIRLAREQRCPQPRRSESRLERWLGIKYLTGHDTTRNLHSSTGFVEFTSIETKQAAIQCNLTGVSNLMVVSPVPEINDIVWENAHVSRALTQTRKAWANAALVGGLVGWSFLVTLIRSYTGFKDWFQWKLLQSPAVAAFMEVYLPAFIVEGLVRGIPFILKFICQWIRFKSASEKDTYILLWYFCYRLITFIFILVGGSLVESGFNFIENPVRFFGNLADNVALQSQFFITYVLISGGMSTIFFMSQMHNVAKQWFVYKVMNEEASSQRTLDDIESSVKVLHKFELLPIALFIFIVGVLYGAIAPVASVFVVAYFRCTYKAFKYMMLFYYGKFYENGGQLFYHISTIIFLILYLVVLIIVGYLSLHGTAAMAGISSVILLIIVATQLHVHRTFVQPSRTLSLAKARIIDDEKYSRNYKHRKLNSYRRGNGKQQDDCDENRRRPVDNSLIDSLLEHAVHDVDDEETPILSDDSLDTMSLMDRELADKRMQERYQEHDSSVSDVTDDYASASDFFIYRQPSLNRVTWELAPRPYRKRLDRDFDCEIWR